MTELHDLKTARVLEGHTQKSLANLAGITDITISNIERGRTMAQPQTRQRIEKVLGAVAWKQTLNKGRINHTPQKRTLNYN